jgi:cysteine desulfurase
LEEKGFEVTYLPVDRMGKIKEEALCEAIREDTILVTIIYVNNEIGSIQNIPDLSKKIHKKNPQTILHVDAVQAFGKYHIIPKKEGIDIMSVSAHKLNGPKGVGFLYIKEGIKVQPILYGGGQQRSLRPGTENVSGIVGMVLAVEIAYRNMESNRNTLFALKEKLIKDLNQELDGIHINACRPEAIEETAPHIVSVCFDKIKSEVLLHALEEKGIYVSSGSACSSHHQGYSRVIKAIGVKEELLGSVLRFSLSEDITEEQLTYTVDQLKELLPVLRKYQRA